MNKVIPFKAPERSQQQVKAEECRARRAAKRVGLLARRSRAGLGGIDNFGEFQLIDPYRNCVVAGERYDMTAREVIEFCTPAAAGQP